MKNIRKLSNVIELKKTKSKQEYVRKGDRLSYFFILVAAFLPFFNLYSVVDLSIVGFVKPEDGLGKIPINILETIGDELSVNIIPGEAYPLLTQEVPSRTFRALYETDTTPGRISLFTEGLWSKGGKNTSRLPKESLVKIAYSMFETTQIPSMWVKILNEEFDAVVVPDEYYVRIYQKCGVQLPIFVLPIPMMMEAYLKHEPHPLKPSSPFVFGDASGNKNPGVLVEAFAKAFKNDPNVRLVVRAGILRPEARLTIGKLIQKYKINNVLMEEGFLDLNQYIDRMLSFDCYVNLSKGEGFSLIPREALSLGVPCILTNNTASQTICKSGWVRSVPSNQRVQPIPIYQLLFGEDCGKQFDCKVEDVAAALRDVYENYGSYIKRARRGIEWVKQYDCYHPSLKDAYLTLFKPQRVVLGSKNTLKNGVITTTSQELVDKYRLLPQ